MSGGKGGSQTTQVEIPKYLEDPIKQNIAQAQDMAKIGYIPQYGPDVAGFSPMQQAAFANTNQAAQAFGMSGVNTQPQYAPMASQPQATQSSGGKGGGEPQQQQMQMQQIDPYTGMPMLRPGQMGYSSGDLFEQQRGELSVRRPAQYSALESNFIDPVGRQSSSPSGGKGGGTSMSATGARDALSAEQNAAAEKARKEAAAKAASAARQQWLNDIGR